MFSALKDLAAKSRKPNTATATTTVAAPVIAVSTPTPPVSSSKEEVDPATSSAATAEPPSSSSSAMIDNNTTAVTSSSSTAVAEATPPPPGYLPTTIGRCLRWRVANIDALLLETALRCSEIIENNGDLPIQAALPPMLNIRANDSFGIIAIDNNDASSSSKEPFDVDTVETHAQKLLEGLIRKSKSTPSNNTTPPTPLQSLLQELVVAFTDFRFVAAKAQISVVDIKQRNYQSRLQEIRHEFIWSGGTSTAATSPPKTIIHANARLLHAIDSLLEMATSKILVPPSSSSGGGNNGGGGAPTITTYRQLISATNSLSLRLLVSERTSIVQEVLAYQTRIKALLPLLPILATTAGGKRPRADEDSGEAAVNGGNGANLDALAERYSIYRMPQSVVSTGHTLLSTTNSSHSYHELLNVLFFEGRRKLTSIEQLGKMCSTHGGNTAAADVHTLKFPRLRAYMLDRPVSFGDVEKKRNVDSSSDSDNDDTKNQNIKSDTTTTLLTINKFFARCIAASKGDIRTALHKVSEAHVSSGWEPIFDAVSQAYLDDSKGYSSPQYDSLMLGGGEEQGMQGRDHNRLPHVLYLCADTPDGAVTAALSAKYTTAAKDTADSQAVLLPLPPKLSTCLIDIMDHVSKASTMLVVGGRGVDGGVGSWKGRLTEVSHALEDAENAYGLYTMGTDKWRSGISGGSVHMRRKLEKINKVHITHVMNNPVVKAAMLTVKTLVNDVTAMVEEAREGYQYTDAIQQ